MTKPPTNGNAAKALADARELFRTARSFGPEVPALARDVARRAAGFGSDPVDQQILKFVIANYGSDWRVDRPLHPWERGGGDAKLDELFTGQDDAIGETARTEAAMWAVRDRRAAAHREGGVSDPAILLALEKELEKAITAWEKSQREESLARGRVTSRQIVLADRYWRQRETLEAKAAKAKS